MFAAKALVVLAVVSVFTTAAALSVGAERRRRIGVSSDEADAVERVDVPDTMPVDTYATLERRGAWTITGLVIHRSPIQSYIPKVLNFLSGGKWREALDTAGGYDKMFHLSVVTTVVSPDGKQTEHWKIEKSPNVEMTKVAAAALDVLSPANVKLKLEAHAFAVQPNTKLNDLFRDAKTTKGFWLYDAFNRPPYEKNGGNCQDFIRRVLTAISPAGVLPADTLAWVFQDGVTIGEKLGWFSRAVAKTLTNTGAIVDIAKDTIAHPMVKVRQIKQNSNAKEQAKKVGGSFIAVESEAEADVDDEDEADADVSDEEEDENDSEEAEDAEIDAEEFDF